MKFRKFSIVSLIALLTTFFSLSAARVPSFEEGDETIITTESGLKYRVIVEGTGSRPSENGKVKVYYHGYLPDGTVFDETDIIRPPVEFNMEVLIEGWKEALLLMKTGAIWEIYIPSELAYGERGSRGKVPSNTDIIFEVELIEATP
jgi:FKBP-type peptidyl-prolyl cis-trans isomerase